jgi:hypothetical protein
MAARIISIKKFDDLIKHRTLDLPSCSIVPHPLMLPRVLDIKGNCCYFNANHRTKKSIKKTPWSESASELYRPSDRRLSAKLVPTYADRECQVVSVTDPNGRILGFIDRSRYFSIK